MSKIDLVRQMIYRIQINYLASHYLRYELMVGYDLSLNNLAA